MQSDTIKIKPSHESQGQFVVINASDYDPEVHELLEGEATSEDVNALPRRSRRRA